MDEKLKSFTLPSFAKNYYILLLLIILFILLVDDNYFNGIRDS